MDNPDINPIWDAYMGEDTNTGVIRLVAGVVVFVVVCGTVFWMITPA